MTKSTRSNKISQFLIIKKEKENRGEGNGIITYKLSNGFGKEVVVAAMGGGERRSFGFEVEVPQYFPIGQWFQKQLFREFFLEKNRSEGDEDRGEADLEGEYEKD